MTRTHRRLAEVRDLGENLHSDYYETVYILDQLEQQTADLLMAATQIQELAAETAEDIRQASFGNRREACTHCDGTIYVDRDEFGPLFFCIGCAGAGWAAAYFAGGAR
ncbi:hypothetical protein FB565_001526 [Actinoplanes lutulentus]|uniref:Uncharacterized protein n=1 Tax=Actinoplanes lutulentus TaxID=1287878 RepID=A0A327ZM99_9ACTN|nr:hypothetical protein [Actinoplanes lutulentus]MBB2941822.1 hypothetical protein [Actinoplanes lutulentus]RAK39741.1 hypothetical protein B0I29_104279 [Actinoplanes lutulentus]